MIRLFLAIDVPDRVRRPIDAAVAPLRAHHAGLRWTTPEGWHLTLAFLGWVAEDVARVAELVRPVVGRSPRLRLTLAGAGRFGRRVLWLGVHDDPPGALAILGERLQSALDGAGLPVDRKAVRGHLTLARAARSGVGRELVEAVPAVEGSWEAAHVLVVRSHLGGRGPARYESLHELPLGS